MRDFTLSVAQLATLGAALVLASFSLNALLVRSVVADFRQRLERIEESLTGDDGVKVRLAVLWEDRRTGPRDRRGVIQ